MEIADVVGDEQRVESAEADGRVPVAVVNHELGLGAYPIFRRDQLPHHFVWRMLGEGTYVVGIEPCTNRTAGRLDARARGELIELEAGESRTYELELARSSAKRAERVHRPRPIACSSTSNLARARITTGRRAGN